MTTFVTRWLGALGLGLAASCAMVAPTAQAQEKEKPVVVFIATGGTIAMKIDPVTKGVVPAISGDDLMQSVPDASKYARNEANNFYKMSSNYNTRGRAAEVLVDGDQVFEVRRRETVAELFAGESLLPE